MKPLTSSFLILNYVLLLCNRPSIAFAPHNNPTTTVTNHHHYQQLKRNVRTTPRRRTFVVPRSTPSEDDGESLSVAPTFDGKMVFPIKALTTGLRGHKVAAVYAVLNRNYKRGSPGEEWKHCEYVGFTRDLDSDLRSHVQSHGPTKVAHVRALSFAYPQKTAMEEVAARWKGEVLQIGGTLDWTASKEEDDDDDGEEEERKRKELVELMEATADYDDDDDDDEDDDEFEFLDEERTIVDMTDRNNKQDDEEEKTAETEATISPFEQESSTTTSEEATTTTTLDKDNLVFNMETVDKILDEVRPYLISDGGNVSVQSVDPKTKNVYLVLEGACGSCSSSTVTMQMGIERVLRENFSDLGEVVEVEDPKRAEEEPKELTLEAVQAEVNRIGPAVVAMGGAVEIVGVDPIGVAEIEFRGPNKVKQGLELALMDVPFLKHVKFVN